jgi:Predicted transcriptional regulators
MAQVLETIGLDKIDIASTQTRRELCPRAIDDYTAVLKEGGTLDPPVVFRDGNTLWLSCGFHRLQAHRREGHKEVLCEVREGTKWDAIRFGIEDNLKHQGVRITRADRADNVDLALREGPGDSDHVIAELCGVVPTTVANHRKRLKSTGQIGQSPMRRGRDGREYRYEPFEQDSAHIGSNPDAASHEAALPPSADSDIDAPEPATASLPAAVTPRQPDPKELFKVCIHDLGRLKAKVAEMRHEGPGRANRICRLIDEIYEALQDWQKNFGDDAYSEAA